MQFKRWNIRQTEKTLATELAEECNTSPFVALLATARGYTDPAVLDEFLSDEVILSNVYELRDIEKAAEIINEAIYCEEKIAVFGDYDADGITATVLMFSYLRSRGANVTYFIPDRQKDGYGINISAIDKLKSEGISLIITVDNGIAAVDEVSYAKSHGIKVVVTDHHLPHETLPEADAVVNPHRSDDNSEFKDICGVFVAFKVVCATEGKSAEEMLYEYGDLVALGTVADVMPLVNENRAVVKEGLNLIANGGRRGLNALMRAAAIEDYALTASHLAFGIIPRINAAGRMGDAARAAELLLTDDDEAAEALAGILNNENIKRQSLEKQIYSEALQSVEKCGFKHNRVIVVSGENWHPGVIGIVAARLCERYSKPVVVLSVSDGVAHGSARSIAGFSIYDALEDSSYLLEKFGGHEMAAGLTIYENSIDTFRRAINDYALKFKRHFPEIVLDCKLNPAALGIDLAEEIKELEPFGQANPMPQFAIMGLKIEGISPVGQGKHLRLTLSKDNCSFQAMLFGVQKNAFAYDKDDVVDIAVTLDTNVFNNVKNLTVSIKDIRKSGISAETTEKQIDMYENFKAGLYGDFSDITPTRQEVGQVYKELLKKPACLDRIIGMNIDTIGYAKALISAEALCELKTCAAFDADGVKMIKVVNDARVNLPDAPILKKLRGEIYDS